MRLTESVHLVGSGVSGNSLTNTMDCNVFLINGETECALIDSGIGIEPEKILMEIELAGFNVEQVNKIFLTHGHGDHAGGAYDLAEACGAKIYAFGSAAKFINNGDTKALSIDLAIEAGLYPSDYEFKACPAERLGDNETLAVGKLVLEVIATEGHSAGHCSFLLQEDGRKILFSGDCIQCDGKIAVQPIPDCDLQQYVSSILRLHDTNIDVLLPGHGRFALNDGHKHIEAAVKAFNELKLPPNTTGLY